MIRTTSIFSPAGQINCCNNFRMLVFVQYSTEDVTVLCTMHAVAVSRGSQVSVSQCPGGPVSAPDCQGICTIESLGRTRFMK